MLGRRRRLLREPPPPVDQALETLCIPVRSPEAPEPSACWPWREFQPDSSLTLASYHQWLAGIIDGDGHLRFSPDGSTSLEIGGHRLEQPVLELVRALLGGQGSVRLRPGTNSLRYRVGQGRVLRRLLAEVGPYLRHEAKRYRLREIGRHLGCPPIAPALWLASNRSWVAGAIQSDGHVLLGRSGEDRQGNARFGVAIGFTNREGPLVEAVASFFPSTGSFGPTGEAFRWESGSWRDLESIGAYLLSTPFAGPKRQRLMLLMTVIHPLLEQRAHLPSSSAHCHWHLALLA
jgi:hypothetical protein